MMIIIIIIMIIIIIKSRTHAEKQFKTAEYQATRALKLKTLKVAERAEELKLKPEIIISNNKEYYENKKQYRAKVPYTEELKLYHTAYHAAWFQRRKRKNYF
jgi:hypothetical protein